MKNIITKKEYLAIVGLMTLAHSYYEKIKDCEKSYGEIVDMEKDCGSYGHFSDEIFGDGDAKEALKNEGIKVKA
jgi:hypothetical protein